MKNKFIISFFLFILSNKVFAEDLLIEAKKISINKESQITIFED